MKPEIKITKFKNKNSKRNQFPKFGYVNAKEINKFHKSFPDYEKTPLVSLKNTSEALGLHDVLVKDESYRFGLNAFKVLGGSYAIAKYISKTCGISIGDLTFERLVSDELKKELGEVTFITATDGNHGRGVAWMANKIGQNSVVYMPKGTTLERLENIKSLGSKAEILDLNYDDAVRKANKDAKLNGWIVIQDTSWTGYEEVPRWIMEGYTSMGYEIVSQVKELNYNKPTHIILQAGVGAMAGAMTYFFKKYYNKEAPIIVIIESDQADCFYKTVEAKDGKIHFIDGDLNTIMAGLACGEPCEMAWDILKEYADFFVSVPDTIAETGMIGLANPFTGDKKIISGESGAVGYGFIKEIMNNNKYIHIRKELGINNSSSILCISTEGDTDKENYKKIVL